MGHRCGYVGVPKGHSLYGKDYSDYLDIKKEDIGNKEISGIFPFIFAVFDNDERVRIEAYFDCHGGITFSGDGKTEYPVVSDNLWWFGFDCTHCDDGKDLDLAIKLFPKEADHIKRVKEIETACGSFRSDTVRDTEYVVENCKRLAEQLTQYESERKEYEP